MNGDSVVKDWLGQVLTRKMQSVVLCGLRGCDGANKEDVSKPIVRKMRQTVFNPANPNFQNDPNDSFMKDKVTSEIVDQFIGDLDAYPMHWLMHFLHAAEIIGYFHPVEVDRIFWYRLYTRAVREGLHLNPETKEQVTERLKDLL